MAQVESIRWPFVIASFLVDGRRARVNPGNWRRNRDDASAPRRALVLFPNCNSVPRQRDTAVSRRNLESGDAAPGLLAADRLHRIEAKRGPHERKRRADHEYS